MNASELFRAGRLAEAITAVGAELRGNPADVKRRTFLFELLCFAGEYDRAQKHLEVLSGGSPDAATGALVYHAALHAERKRQELFENDELPADRDDTEKPPVSGTLNGQPFASISDADSAIGARIEILAAGDYLWIPLEHVAELGIEQPRRLRDLLWTPALLKTGPGFKGVELGEVLIPALYPLSWKHPDDNVRLGRATVWEDDMGHVKPLGQRMLLVDDEEFPFLEVRQLQIHATPAAS